MDAASAAVFLISHEFLRSDFILKEEVARLIERREREGLPIVPVYLHKCDWEAVDWLSRMQIRPAGDRWIVQGEAHAINADFADIAKEIRLLLQPTEPVPPAGRPARGLAKAPDLARLPRTGEHLFGRERELALLDGAWADEQTNIISLIAWGGVGKSALVKHWLGRMAREQYRGARLVYGWSFYKQSLREEEASADEFFADALHWFGEPKPERFQQTERARRLAELIQKDRTILVLDGLEPLQHSSKTGPEGQIKDHTLAELVRLLAWHNLGVLVITSRYVVDDVRDQRATTAPVIELGHLSPQAGAQLLRALGVEGEQGEVETASREFGGHSLALNLLGTYIRDILDNDVRRRGEVSLLAEDAEHGGYARRIMRSYEKQFGESPELAGLHLIGLFDRPAKRELINVLRQPPIIDGLNDRLVGQSERDWHRALARLKQAKLLSEETPDELDAHPLVREHFGARLKTERPAAWRAGQGRLYEYLRDSSKRYPNTLAEMAPLFQAMHHGCQAERHQDACDQVFWPRISRRNKFYANKKLGAVGAELAALAGFFDPPFAKPISCLPDSEIAWILNHSAYDLRALGRLREALEPMLAALELDFRRANWQCATISACTLSELRLSLGEVNAALEMAEASVALADRIEDPFWRMGSRVILGDALHQVGETARAQKEFEEAEALQTKFEPDNPRLYMSAGYRYCDFLLAQRCFTEVRERATYALDVTNKADLSLLAAALDCLSLGRALMGLGEPVRGRALLDQAIGTLRKAGTIHHIPRALLARAALFRETDEFQAARRDLDEAMRIAGRSEMRLDQCDAHLEYARLALAEGDKEQARGHVAAAQRLVEECGYGRRRPEVEALEAEVR